MGIVHFPIFLVVILFGNDYATSSFIEDPFNVAAWNLQRLGQTKMGKPEVVDIIVQVMRRYDIVIALEVVDASGETPLLLLDALNEGLTDTYNLTISERLGRTSYKEQYAFYWKPSRVNVVSTFQYDDTALDVFQFEPFVVVFEGNFDDRLASFGVVPIHTKPSDAVAEVNALADVYDSFKQATGVDDVIIIGDFNCGCDYVGSNDYDSIRLWTDSRFTWLISDHIDTTVKGTTCPYDRVVLAGTNMLEATYKSTAKPFYFEEQLGLTDQDLIEDVSDHYPVEVLVRGAVSSSTKATVTPTSVVSVTISVTSEAISTLSSALINTIDACAMSDDVVLVTWSVNSTFYALDAIDNFSDDHPDVISKEAVAVVRYKVENKGLEDPSLYGEEPTPTDSLKVTLLCQKSQTSCIMSLIALTDIN